MGALGGLLGMGPAHQVQSQRGSAGFQGFGDDKMGGLMHNDSGMSRPDSYTGGYPLGMSGAGGGGSPPGGFDPFRIFAQQGGQMGQQGGMQGGGQGPQGNPYGIQPPRGLQGGGGPQQQSQQNNPLAGLFSMLGGL